MINRYEHVITSVEKLGTNEKFKLFLTYFEGGKKPLLLGMHLSYNGIYTTPSAQVSNYFRSVLRKFGNEFLRKIAPNDYFSIEEYTVEKVIYKSLFCKFIENEKVYIDVVEAHALTQAWDQLMNKYDLSRLFCSGQIIMATKGPNGLIQRMTESNESDPQENPFPLPQVINDFLEKIVETERI
ncbi:MAG: hypothetical protein PHQ22_08940 [Sulfuricurvum sp.]|nr:hypothetical protein [Sulfuricurvum sp.]